MNDVIGRISLYHNLFQICLILSIIFLVVAVNVFFMLDIRFTLGYLTGRSAKKQIKELEEANAASGRLISKGKSMQYVAQEMKNDMGVRQAAAPGIRKVEHAVQPAVIPIIPQETRQTEAFFGQGTEGTQLLHTLETSLLQENATEVLAENKMNYQNEMEGSTAVLEEKTASMGRFMIIRELMLIHTEEVI